MGGGRSLYVDPKNYLFPSPEQNHNYTTDGTLKVANTEGLRNSQMKMDNKPTGKFFSETKILEFKNVNKVHILLLINSGICDQ